jgi:serine/threonine-protein kinase
VGVLKSQVTGRQYQLVAALAKGGMGEVYVAREVGPKAPAAPRWVAVKTLLPEVLTQPGFLARFLDEARVSARLDHPKLARLLDFGEAAGRPFLAFELLEGADLDDTVSQAHAQGQPVPVDIACRVVAQAARGLAHAHALAEDGRPLGIVHRDLSPGNLFLAASGQVKVLDFGAAAGRDRLARTATGLVIGKVQYMAPEQVRGAPLDGRTDQFALALCLHELLTHQRPHEGLGEREQLRLAFEGAAPDLEGACPEAPEALVALHRRATAVDPADRFPDCVAFAEALEAVVRAGSALDDTAALARYARALWGAERVPARRAQLEALWDQRRPDDDFRWDAPPLPSPPRSAPQPTTELQPVQRTPWLVLGAGLLALVVGVAFGVWSAHR